MPSLLLLGYPDICTALMAGAPDSHTLYYLGDEPLSAGGRTAMPLMMGNPVPEDLVAILDLYIDPVEKLEAIEALPVDMPAGTVLFTNVLTITATAVAAWHGGTLPTVGISYVPHLFAAGSLVEACFAMQTAEADRDAAIALLRTITAHEVEVLNDRVALVSARTLAMVINEAAFALMEGVAGAGDIDTAMKLGTNYPYGPLHWADQIGLDIVLHILQALYEEYQEERYRPCVLLKQYVRAGKEIAGKAEG